MKLIDIYGSTVTIDTIGTQTIIIEQIHEQEGNFVLTVKNNQSDACEKIHCFIDKFEEEAAKERSGGKSDSALKEYLEKYEEINKTEKNCDRYEYQTYKICNDASEWTKTQKEWKHIKSIRQVRVPIQKNRIGNDITPSKDKFLKRETKKSPVLATAEGAGKDIQCVAMISDWFLTAEELGNIKRMHWLIKNQLHHVLDDTFQKDHSPAKKSQNNLTLIRKYAYNILRLTMVKSEKAGIMTICGKGAEA